MGCASSTPADEHGAQHANGVQAAKYVAPSAAASALPSMNGASSAAATQGSPAVATALASPGPIPAKSPSSDARSSLGPPPVDPRISQETKRSSSQLANGPHTPGSSESSSAVNPSLKSLTVQEVHTVQSTLMKVSVLIQKFAEGKNDRTTPIQALRRAMDLVIADAHANYASVQVVHETLDSALLVALVGAPDQFLEHNRLQRLGQSGTAAEIMIASKTDCLTWNPSAGAQLPTDWHQLVTGAAMRHLSAVPIRVAERIIGILTLGFTEDGETHADHALWSTYLQLVAASLSSVVKDSAIPKYLTLVKEVYLASDIDGLIHMMVTHMRSVLGHSNNHHNWYRFALTGSSNMAATIFDDLTQVPVTLMQRGLSSHAGSSSNRLLKEVQASGGVMRTVVAMKSTVMKISVHNRQQVMIPDVQKLINQSGNVSVDIFNTRLIKPPTSVLVFPLKVKHHIFGVVFCMSSVATDFADVSPRLRELCEVVSPHILTMLNTTLALEYSVVQNALPSNPEGGSMSGIMISQSSRNASFSGRSIGGNNDAAASFASNDSFVFTQSRSSTGALVTGLTEKLNQKRIKSSMDFAGTHALGDLQVQALLGEGGFAKVFRGLWRGLVVGIKVVCDDGKNEKMVMKNAHEIAILGALSHPNIVQAYTCLTDVAVHDLLTSSFRSAPLGVLHSPAYKYLAGMEDRPCHIEVIEYCDLGNLSTALKYAVFQVPHPEKVLAAAVALGNKEGPGGSDANGGEVNASNQLLAEVRGQAGRVQMRTLLLTLIEIASAMAYLHRMGVVHCDIKPANVLLRSSSTDTRGFTAKVSDFGLSRVEDDEMHASFPFNSCGTAAYVAPEALICNKKVNSSVDVYAFGILMWEMYTCARPYGNMKQQALVEEVVMRGLRPRFPSHTPAPYVLLAQACWSGSAQSRPLFDEALTTLNNMLSALDDREIGSTASASFASNTDVVEYMAANSPGGPGPAMNGTLQAPVQGVAPMQGGGFAEAPKSPTGGVVDRIVAGRSSNGAPALRGVMVGDNSPARSAAGTGSGGPSGSMPSVYAALNSGGAGGYGGGSGNVNGPNGRRTVSRNTSMTGDAGKHGSFPAQPSGLSAMTSPYISPAKDALVPAVTATIQ